MLWHSHSIGLNIDASYCLVGLNRLIPDPQEFSKMKAKPPISITCRDPFASTAAMHFQRVSKALAVCAL